MLSSQVSVQSGNAPGTFRGRTSRNQEPGEDLSQNDNHLEVMETEDWMPHAIIPEPKSTHPSTSIDQMFSR